MKLARARQLLKVIYNKNIKRTCESGLPHHGRDPLGLAGKDVVHMVEYIMNVIYLVLLYKIVREIK